MEENMSGILPGRSQDAPGAGTPSYATVRHAASVLELCTCQWREYTNSELEANAASC